MNDRPVIVWFRNDLRIEDNPALYHARESGAPVLCIYILDDGLPHAPGAASRWWLHHSLKSLAHDLEKAGAGLVLRRGDSQKAIWGLVKDTGAIGVYWNRRYYGPHLDIDKAIIAALKEVGVEVQSFSATLLREPWELKTAAGDPYRVFTPFWKALRGMGPTRRQVLPRIRKIHGPSRDPESEKLSDWNLQPKNPDWAEEIDASWRPGEQGAQERLNAFLRNRINEYAMARDCPHEEATSRLSPHLAFGEIGPLQIWSAVRRRVEAGAIEETQAEKFLSEVAWREFSHNLLFYNPALPETPLRKEFADFRWRGGEGLNAWCEGRTGYPIVDAGMRQLWRRGWMHNRVRMIVASFLIKDLLIPWQKGEAWFWDTLVDADLANNSANWQWVAGCGADSAPWFRVFNPVTQGEKFDPHGDYVREFVPELTDLPEKFIHAPWRAPHAVLQKARVTLGKSYPNPIIDHGQARRRALAEYDRIKVG